MVARYLRPDDPIPLEQDLMQDPRDQKVSGVF